MSLVELQRLAMEQQHLIILLVDKGRLELELGNCGAADPGSSSGSSSSGSSSSCPLSAQGSTAAAVAPRRGRPPLAPASGARQANGGSALAFTGHFIVVCGFDPEAQQL